MTECVIAGWKVLSIFGVCAFLGAYLGAKR